MSDKEPRNIFIDGAPDTIQITNMQRPAREYFDVGFNLAAGVAAFGLVCLVGFWAVYYVANLAKGWW
jgi:hypothetical protein